MRHALNLAAAAALLGATAATMPATAAKADGLFTRSCVGQFGIGNCVVQWRVYPSRQDKTLAANPEEMSPEAQERDKKWLERCKPQGRQDEYGVTRLRYARPGCEFGKTED